MAAHETARRVVVAIAVGRIAIGGGALLASRPTLRALGFPGTDAPGQALAKLTGARDIVLGALTLGARDDLTALRAVTMATVAVDVSDALTLGLAGRRDSELRLAGIGGLASGGSAALAGAWAWRRLQT
jgi:hypothetical protein